MRSKEIGNSRQTEKRLLRDMEVFSSPQFLRLVQRIGKEITDKHDAQIRFYSDATDHRAGYFEGRYIYINTMNMLTQSFPTLDLRSKSLIGVRASELQQYLSETEIYRWNCKWNFISSLAAAGDGARNWIFTKYERGFSKERCGSIRTLSANSRKAAWISGRCLYRRTDVQKVSRKYPAGDFAEP
mgnify:CR=1 FL=1